MRLYWLQTRVLRQRAGVVRKCASLLANRGWCHQVQLCTRSPGVGVGVGVGVGIGGGVGVV